jgi:hypothetical protein
MQKPTAFVRELLEPGAEDFLPRKDTKHTKKNRQRKIRSEGLKINSETQSPLFVSFVAFRG